MAPSNPPWTRSYHSTGYHYYVCGMSGDLAARRRTSECWRLGFVCHDQHARGMLVIEQLYSACAARKRSETVLGVATVRPELGRMT